MEPAQNGEIEMSIRYDAKTLGIAAVALVLAAALLSWGYGAYKTRDLRSTVSASLSVAGGRLRETLSLEPGPAPAPAERLQLAKKFDDHAAAVNQHIEQLKQAQAERDRALTDDADGYLVTVREIIRRRAAINRLYVLHTESLAALRGHMRMDNRTGSWVQQAVRAKERAEKDFRDYRVTVDAYGTLLDTLPPSQKKIAAHITPAALAEEALLARARERELEGVKRAEAEMEKVRKLAAPK
jgi:hypothetical protein